MADNWWKDEEIQKPSGNVGRFAPDIAKSWWADEDDKKQDIKKEKSKDDIISEKLSSSWVPGHETMSKIISPSLTKGVPVARQYVPQPQDLTKFEKENPKTAMGLNAAGTIGSTMPLAAGAAIRSGGGFLAQLGGQTAVNAPLNLADLVAQKGSETTNKDAAKALGTGALSSTFPAALTGVIGQAGRNTARVLTPEFEMAKTHSPRPSHLDKFMNWFKQNPSVNFPPGRVGVPPNMASQMPPGGAVPGPGAPIPGTSVPGTGRTLSTVLAGAAGAAHDPMTAVMAAYLAHRAGPSILNTLSHTPVGRIIDAGAHHPTTQDLLRVLAGETGRQIAPKLAF